MIINSNHSNYYGDIVTFYPWEYSAWVITEIENTEAVQFAKMLTL
jgi:hypothetical protein